MAAHSIAEGCTGGGRVQRCACRTNDGAAKKAKLTALADAKAITVLTEAFKRSPTRADHGLGIYRVQ